MLKKFNLTDEDVNTIKEIFGGINESELNDYKNYKKMVKDFKFALENKEIDIEKSNYKLIIVDELDRCRPNFAIEVLETIKHIFNVEGLIFIFMINKNLLNKSVETLYGNINDDEEYFKKFFDIEFSLPKLEYENYLEKEYLEELNEDNLIRSEDDKGIEYDLRKFGFYVFLKTVEILKKSKDFSSREQKLMFRKYKILYMTFDKEESSNLDFLILMSAYILFVEKNKEKIGFLNWFGSMNIKNKEMMEMERFKVSPSDIKSHLEGLITIIRWIAKKYSSSTDYLTNEKGTYCSGRGKGKTNINISNTITFGERNVNVKYYNIHFPNSKKLSEKQNLIDGLEEYFRNKYEFLESIK